MASTVVAGTAACLEDQVRITASRKQTTSVGRWRETIFFEVGCGAWFNRDLSMAIDNDRTLLGFQDQLPSCVVVESRRNNECRRKLNESFAAENKINHTA